MRQLNDYHCNWCNTTVEYLANPQDVILCDCASEAELTRVISAGHFILDGASGDFPTAAAKWETRRVQQIAEEQRQES